MAGVVCLNEGKASDSQMVNLLQPAFHFTHQQSSPARRVPANTPHPLPTAPSPAPASSTMNDGPPGRAGTLRVIVIRPSDVRGHQRLKINSIVVDRIYKGNLVYYTHIMSESIY